MSERELSGLCKKCGKSETCDSEYLYPNCYDGSSADMLEELIEDGYIKHCIVDVRRIEERIRKTEDFLSQFRIKEQAGSP